MGARIKGTLLCWPHVRDYARECVRCQAHLLSVCLSMNMYSSVSLRILCDYGGWGMALRMEIVEQNEEARYIK